MWFRAGFARVVLSSDTEPAIIALRTAIGRHVAGQVGTDVPPQDNSAGGPPAWERRLGHALNRPIADLGEQMLCMSMEKCAGRLSSTFLPGVFLGLALQSNEILVEDGVVAGARSFRKLPEAVERFLLLLWFSNCQNRVGVRSSLALLFRR